MPRVARPSEATAFARSAYITDIIFFMLCAIATVVNSALVKILPPQQGVFLGADVWFSPSGLCEVSFWWPMQCCPFGCTCGLSVRLNLLGAS